MSGIMAGLINFDRAKKIVKSLIFVHIILRSIFAESE